MQSLMISFLNDKKQEITDSWMDKIRDLTDKPKEDAVFAQDFQTASIEFIRLTLSHIIEDKTTSPAVHHFIEKIFHMGWTLEQVTTGFIAFKTTFNECLDKAGFAIDEQLDLNRALEDKLVALYKTIVNKYTERWEKTVTLQKTALRELSAPLIPVFEGISVMPLIGTIDTERAKQIMETLLSGVVKNRSEVVLIDITGVPVVDTMVAHHLMKVAEAISLVGSKCMLVGIRPEIAQTIINIGMKLNSILTNNTLQKGMEKALEMTNRKIVRLEGRE
ncbi:MAG TPA: STAS domain-containing protein [Bacillus sp. (in: firmicutes)]|uniref:STAS domain-containing protein n=1 Tax=Bacillus litorisediminis TaxID=2922713 RepID=UPI002435F8B0|nr:STAS domain-containing protein [Bacillus litorisediminis]HWO76787.1 STAS domain-containing protein [Bacillus sp. (in: firmicutes)]